MKMKDDYIYEKLKQSALNDLRIIDWLDKIADSVKELKRQQELTDNRLETIERWLVCHIEDYIGFQGSEHKGFYDFRPYEEDNERE